MKLHAALALLSLAGCSTPSPTIAQGLSTTPDVPGTVFTIVFENENGDAILNPSLPFFNSFAQANGQALQYTSSTHPSLPNYIQLVSGSNNGINNDNDPNFNLKVFGNENLADQLDGAGVKWRAYMEGMGTPCRKDSADHYSAHHNPFLYFGSMVDNPARCNDRIVDFDQNFSQDLASGAYRYMWITPNTCNDMHDCSLQTGDAWLKRIVEQIQASPAYQNGGAIFILFDEGYLRVFGAKARLATVVASPNLVSPSFTTSTPMDHSSYVATIEDIFGMPRLPSTTGVQSMDEFFKPKSTPMTP
jgi:hypothetical protein